MPDLTIVPATPESVAPFGCLIGVSAQAPALDIPFYKGAVKVYSPGTFVSDADTELTVAAVDPRPLSVRWMERHFKHTQTFIPLLGRPFVMILAPPTDGELPDLDHAQALLFAGDAGFAMHVGTWHEFPFAVVDDTRLVVILRREATQSLATHAVIDGEAHGPDIDKKDLVARLGCALSARFL